jgi:predicted PolB exonuclease-like 3'-5' exonuclease
LLHGYGTEAIRGDWQNGYWCDIVAVYVNTGDTYNTTVIQVRTNYGSRFVVSNYGDFIEKNEKRLGIY